MRVKLYAAENLLYDIRGEATFNADNVPLSCLPIALLYKKSIYLWLWCFRIATRYQGLDGPWRLQCAIGLAANSATTWEIDEYLPMALLDSPYDIRCGEAFDADNVPLGHQQIALLYEKSIDICQWYFWIQGMILEVGRTFTLTMYRWAACLSRDYLTNRYILGSSYDISGRRPLTLVMSRCAACW